MINVKKEIISKRRVSRITSIHGTLKKNSHPERSERLERVIGKFLRNYFTLTIALKTAAVFMIGILQFLSNKHKRNERKEKPFSNIDSKAAGHTRVDTDCFRHRYTDFGHTNLGVHIFTLS